MGGYPLVLPSLSDLVIHYSLTTYILEGFGHLDH